MFDGANAIGQMANVKKWNKHKIEGSSHLPSSIFHLTYYILHFITTFVLN